MLDTGYGRGERHTVLKDLKIISVGQRDRCWDSSLWKAGQPPFSRTLAALGLQGAFTLGLCTALCLGQTPCAASP